MAGLPEFDHAVVMVRDRLQAVAPVYEAEGFRLSDTAMHNLGSCNRLMVLQDSYVELLGWPPGAPPARKEIADSPFGLEALVFRSHDAQATHDRLKAEGFAVNPVQALSRPALLDGREVQARFDTLRFAEQPLAGFRMYFCQHLTPECVWMPSLMAHPNGARRLSRIDIQASDPQAVAQCLARVIDLPAQRCAEGWALALANLSIVVGLADVPQPRLAGLTLGYQDGQARPLTIAV
ncbi:VOC family protein [Bordetella trematum]|uniref:VOC family protein n=1 Tax=Bordetella trematum TaxID=123899 RepID=UPI00398944AC